MSPYLQNMGADPDGYQALGTGSSMLRMERSHNSPVPSFIEFQAAGTKGGVRWLFRKYTHAAMTTKRHKGTSTWPGWGTLPGGNRLRESNEAGVGARRQRGGKTKEVRKCPTF